MRDIFRDGPSSELQAEWDRLEALENRFWASSPEERERLLDGNPELRELVTCESCKQVLPGPRFVDAE